MQRCVFSLFILLMAVATARADFSYEIPRPVLDQQQEQTRALAIFKQIDAWLAPLQKPKQLDFASACESFHRVRKEFGLVYDPMTHWIQLQGLAKYPNQHHATLIAHEYGHAIFRANIQTVSSRINDDFANSLKLRALIRQDLKQTAPDRCEQPASDESFEIQKLRKLMEDNSYFTFYSLMLGAYDELFADIVAVLYTQKPDAVFEAIGGDQVNWVGKYGVSLPAGYRGRDFTYVLDPAIWGTRRYMSFYDFLGAQSDMYNVLDPVRGFLWQNYLKNLSRDRYPDFFAAYLEAVGIEFERYVDETIWDQPVPEMNLRFIQNLQTRLRSHGFVTGL